MAFLPVITQLYPFTFTFVRCEAGIVPSRSKRGHLSLHAQVHPQTVRLWTLAQLSIQNDSVPFVAHFLMRTPMLCGQGQPGHLDVVAILQKSRQAAVVFLRLARVSFRINRDCQRFME